MFAEQNKENFAFCNTMNGHLFVVGTIFSVMSLLDVKNDKYWVCLYILGIFQTVFDFKRINITNNLMYVQLYCC